MVDEIDWIFLSFFLILNILSYWNYHGISFESLISPLEVVGKTLRYGQIAGRTRQAPRKRKFMRKNRSWSALSRSETQTDPYVDQQTLVLAEKQRKARSWDSAIGRWSHPSCWNNQPKILSSRFVLLNSYLFNSAVAILNLHLSLFPLSQNEIWHPVFFKGTSSVNLVYRVITSEIRIYKSDLQWLC